MKRSEYIWFVRCFLALVVLTMTAGCGEGNSVPSTPVVGEDSPQIGQAPATGVNEYALGATFEVNGLKWKVVSAETLPEIESLFSDTEPHKPGNGTWLVVTLDFQGKEGAEGGYDIAALKLRDGSGKLYDVAEPGGAADDYRLTHEGVKNLSMAMLGDTEMQRVFAIFDIPASAESYTLEWLGVDGGSLVTLAKVTLSE
jgi:hypothetical protein